MFKLASNLLKITQVRSNSTGNRYNWEEKAEMHQADEYQTSKMRVNWLKKGKLRGSWFKTKKKGKVFRAFVQNFRIQFDWYLGFPQVSHSFRDSHHRILTSIYQSFQCIANIKTRKKNKNYANELLANKFVNLSSFCLASTISFDLIEEIYESAFQKRNKSKGKLTREPN